MSSQPERIPSSRSLLSRDERLPLDAWKTFLEINFVRLIHLEVFLKEFNLTDVQRNRATALEAGRMKTVHTSEDGQKLWHNSNADVCNKPQTASSTMPVELPQNFMVGQERQQISELKFDKFTSPQSFLMWKIQFEHQVTSCSDFPPDAVLWIKEVEMVDSLDELKSSRSVLWKGSFQTSRCWTRRLPLL